MSNLQCLDAVKYRSRVQSSLSVEASTTANYTLRRPQKEKKSQLYDVEVLEEAGAQVKVHYIGYGNEFDEWRPKMEVVLNKPSFQATAEPHSPLANLACCILKRLMPSRSESPDVRIQVPCDVTTFKDLEEKGTLMGNRSAQGGGLVRRYTIVSYADLDDLFGEQWHFRVVNTVGDFSYVILKTVVFYLVKSKPILKYEAKKEDNGTLKFNPVYVEQPTSVVFSFVRGDGNRHKLLDFI